MWLVMNLLSLVGCKAELNSSYATPREVAVAVASDLHIFNKVLFPPQKRNKQFFGCNCMNDRNE
jgi:hypothetical protein